MYINLQHIDVRDEKYQQNFTEVLRALSADPSTVTLPAQKKRKPFGLRTEYVAAIIGAIATIVAALLPLTFRNSPSLDWDLLCCKPVIASRCRRRSNLPLSEETASAREYCLAVTPWRMFTTEQLGLFDFQYIKLLYHFIHG